MKTIIAAIDFSDVSDLVVKHASELARSFGASVCILHASAPEPAFVGYEVGVSYETEVREEVWKGEKLKLKNYVEALKKEGIEAYSTFLQLPTLQAIKVEIENTDADLLVMGSHGHGAVYNLVVGSIAGAALKEIQIPIFIIPAHAVPEKLPVTV